MATKGNNNSHRTLGLTFTYGVSLKQWVDQGLFDREKLIYEKHLEQAHFDKIIWFTYGCGDEKLRDQLVKEGKLDSRVQIAESPRWARGRGLRYIYSRLIPVIYRKLCLELDVIKSNQMAGAEVAYLISKRYATPFALRTGYTATLFYDKRIENSVGTAERLRLKLWRVYFKSLERRLYRKCDIATVSSQNDRDYVISEYGISTDKIRVLSNYIDCELFKPLIAIETRQNNRCVCVSRLSEQKNLKNLIRAVAEVGIGLDIYGDGEQKNELQELANQLSADVCFKGKCANDRLPEIYNKYQFYIIPSYYEGMPKTLLEAMACGCICMGTNVEGIREVIQDGINGILIDEVTDGGISHGLRHIVVNGISEIELKSMSTKAIDYITMNHGLEILAKREYGTMFECICKRSS